MTEAVAFGVGFVVKIDDIPLELAHALADTLRKIVVPDETFGIADKIRGADDFIGSQVITGNGNFLTLGIL